MSQLPHAAFLSYAHINDHHDDGYFLKFAERLRGEVLTQTGLKDFQIFIDRDGIAWGQEWKKRLEQALGATTFLLPMLTPSYFNSDPCREEFDLFRKREDQLQRKDLILPVYYVGCDILEKEEQRQQSKWAQEMLTRQRKDWRAFRFEPWTSLPVRKTLEAMALQIKEALVREADQTASPSNRGKAQPAKKQARKAAKKSKSAVHDLSTESSAVTSAGKLTESNAPTPRTEPEKWVVDSMHRGDFTTIREALMAATPGMRIVVKPGHYEEPLIIDKPVEIIGEGDRDDVVIAVTRASAVTFKTTMGKISNLTIRQTGGGKFFGINITQGRLDIEDCDISSQSLAGVAIRGGADPRLRRNRIHGSAQAGVVISDNGQGTLEDNEIFGNGYAGVEIREKSNPVLRRNRIHDGKQSGVHVYESGLGTLEDNDISGNELAGVTITDGGNPVLRRNRIHDGKKSGVFVYEGGLGTLEDNEILGNALCGAWIQEGANPTLRRNRISKNLHQGIRVHEGGKGTFENNELRDNQKGAWHIAPDCVDLVTRKNNQE